MTRTTSLLLALFTLIGLLWDALPARSEAISRPNVLMIIADDLNDWVGCLGGHPDARTPNVDRLASRGLLFTNAHCAAPVCNPSRVATMTGRRPSSTGIYDNAPVWHEMMPGTASIPQHFNANGYHTAGGGKVYHHMPGFNRRSDWDEYFDMYPPDGITPPLIKEDDLDDLPEAGLIMAEQRRGDLELVRRSGQYQRILQAQPVDHKVFLHEGNIAFGDAPDELKIVMRTAQYEEDSLTTDPPRAYSSISRDGGHTWSPGVPEPDLHNAKSKGYFGRASDGTHIYVYNDGPAQRDVAPGFPHGGRTSQYCSETG